MKYQLKLDFIEQRLEEITPGDWIWWMSEKPPFDIGAQPDAGRSIGRMNTISDVNFVTNAPGDIKALIAEVRQLRKELSELRETTQKHL